MKEKVRTGRSMNSEDQLQELDLSAMEGEAPCSSSSDMPPEVEPVEYRNSVGRFKGEFMIIERAEGGFTAIPEQGNSPLLIVENIEGGQVRETQLHRDGNTLTAIYASEEAYDSGEHWIGYQLINAQGIMLEFSPVEEDSTSDSEGEHGESGSPSTPSATLPPSTEVNGGYFETPPPALPAGETGWWLVDDEIPTNATCAGSCSNCDAW